MLLEEFDDGAAYDDTISQGGNAGGLFRGGYSKACHNRERNRFSDVCQFVCKRSGNLLSRAGNPGNGDIINKTATQLVNGLDAGYVRGGSEEENYIQAVSVCGFQKYIGLFGRHINQQYAVNAGLSGIPAETLIAVGMDRVEIAHQNNRDAGRSADISNRLEDGCQGRARGQCPF